MTKPSIPRINTSKLNSDAIFAAFKAGGTKPHSTDAENSNSDTQGQSTPHVDDTWHVGTDTPPDDADVPPDSVELLRRDAGAVRYGVIGELAQFWHELDGAPLELHLTAQLVALAAMLPSARLMTSFTAPRPLTANLYAAIVAPSSTKRKSTVLRRVETMLWHRGTAQDGTSSVKPLLNCAQYPGLMTPEGFLKAMAASPAGIVIQDEVGMLLGAHKKQATENLSQVLTQAFDGFVPPKQLASETITFSNNIYVNILGATTPARFASVTRALDWDDGFLVRWLFQTATSKVDFQAHTQDWTPACGVQLCAWQNLYATHNDKPWTDFTWQNKDDYYETWHTWQANNMTQAEASSSRDAAIVSRYNVYALKFAMILSVANGGKFGAIKSGVIEDAIHLAEYYMNQVYLLRNGLAERKVDGEKIVKAWQYIQALEKRNETPTARGVQQFCNFTDSATRDDVLEHMRVQGWISIVSDKRCQRLYSLRATLPARLF